MARRVYTEEEKEERRLAEKERAHIYYLEHREEIKARTKQYSVDHPDQVKAAGKIWYEKHKAEESAKNIAYAKAHPEQIRATQKRFRENHREEERERGARYRKENPEKIKTKTERYGREYREEINNRCRIYVSAHRAEVNERNNRRDLQRISAWNEYLTNKHGSFCCAACDAELVLSTRGNGKAPNPVHWDHRHVDTPITTTPGNWLKGNYCTPENVALWEKADFGILCRLCNLAIGPAKDRELHIVKALVYINAHTSTPVTVTDYEVDTAEAAKSKATYIELNINAWARYLTAKHKVFRCEICAKQLIEPTCGLGVRAGSVNWDHSTGKESVSGSPYTWLSTHYPTKENIKTWDECNFGMLCAACNWSLGKPQGRKERFLRFLAYAQGTVV